MIVVLYCLLLLALGFWLRRGVRDAPGYFLAGRELAAWQIGLSMAATAFGGSAILITSQYVYTRGLAGVWFSLAVGLGFLVLGLWFAPRIRATGAHSLADFVGRRHGTAARWLVSLLLVAVQVSFFALTVRSFALITRPLLPEAVSAAASDHAIQAFITIVFVGYTLMGGQKADVAADILRLGLVGAALLGVLLPAALGRAHLGRLPHGLLAFPFNFTTGAGPLFALNMLVMMGLPSIIGGDVFAKVLSTRDGGAARRGLLLAGVIRCLLAFAIAVLALCAKDLLPTLEQPAQAVPLLARQILHPVAFQLVALALLSALLSTGDSVLLTGATVLTHDVLRLSERVGLWLPRLLTLLVAVAGFTLAVALPDVLAILQVGYTLLTAGVTLPVLLPLASGRKLGGGWFCTAMLAGIAAALAWKLNPPGRPWTGLDPATVGAAAAAAITLLGLRR